MKKNEKREEHLDDIEVRSVGNGVDVWASVFQKLEPSVKVVSVLHKEGCKEVYGKVGKSEELVSGVGDTSFSIRYCRCLDKAYSKYDKTVEKYTKKISKAIQEHTERLIQALT